MCKIFCEKTNHIKFIAPEEDQEQTIGEFMTRYEIPCTERDLKFIQKATINSDLNPVSYKNFYSFLKKYNILALYYIQCFDDYNYYYIDVKEPLKSKLIENYNNLRFKHTSLDEHTTYFRYPCEEKDYIFKNILSVITGYYLTAEIGYGYIMRSILMDWSVGKHKTTTISPNISLSDLSIYSRIIPRSLSLLTERWFRKYERSNIDYSNLIGTISNTIYTENIMLRENLSDSAEIPYIKGMKVFALLEDKHKTNDEIVSIPVKVSEKCIFIRKKYFLSSSHTIDNEKSIVILGHKTKTYYYLAYYVGSVNDINESLLVFPYSEYRYKCLSNLTSIKLDTMTLNMNIEIIKRLLE